MQVSAVSKDTMRNSVYSQEPRRESMEGSQEVIGGPRTRRFSTVSGVEGPGVLEFAGSDEPDDMTVHNLKNDSSSVIAFYPEWCQCFECMKHQKDYSPDANFMTHLQNAFLCPPQGPAGRIFGFIIVFILMWIFLWFLLIHAGPECPKSSHWLFMNSPAAPHGPIFALGLLEILGLFTGILMKCIHLPSLLGPLLLGIIINNVDEINLFKNLRGNLPPAIECFNRTLELHGEDNSAHWIKPIREIALTMILTRAGLELSPKQLRKLKGVVPLLAFGPCVVEASACALFTWIFFNKLVDDEMKKMHIYMCFVSGFALAAVSPAVVVPGMLSLKRKGLGVAQGIPTLLIASSSIDDVLAISAYTIFLGLALAVGGTADWKDYAGGPLSILIGVIHGLVVGIFLHFIPSRDNKNKAVMRLVLLLLFNLVAMFGYELSDWLSGAGSLAVLVASFIASFGWRSQAHWKRPMKKIEKTLSHLWTLCVPLLFGTIGREIDFSSTGFSSDRLTKIFAIIFICLLIRMCTAFLIAGVANLNWKERLFCALSWIPKATVQAALAPLVLSKIVELTEEKTKMKLLPHGEIVVTTAVLAILVTAPLGSILIAIFGPILLRKMTEPEKETLEQEFPNGDGVDPVFDEPEYYPVSPNKSQQIFIRRGTTGSITSMTGLNNSGSRTESGGDAVKAGASGELINNPP